MVSPISISRVHIRFSAKSYSEFDVIFKKACLLAGGGIKYDYKKLDKNLWNLEFFYPTQKAASRGYLRLCEMQTTNPNVEILLSLVDD